ncbi:MAG: hypothetical protein JSU86_07080 [Phycisphaerales bacterium]|nr:MAG: hypothetical protein JSU86_07080 [Phycisphaerales bacterium]
MPGRLRDVAAFLFTLSAASEASRRILHFAVSIPLAFGNAEYNVWGLAGGIGYLVFAMLVWVAFRRVRTWPTHVFVGILIAILASAWLLEDEVFGVWYRLVERPILSVLNDFA